MTATVSRRTFLAAPGVAAFGPLARAAAAAEDIKLGVATYSLRKFPRAKAIEMLRELGVRYVSIKSFHLPYELPPAELEAGAREFREAGLTILSGGNIELKNPAELRRMFEYAKACGMPMMVCAPSHETLPEVEKLVREFDIRAAIHNHGPEDKHFPTPRSVLEAVRNMDPRMGLCIDIGHTARTGADILESIREAGPRLFDIHAKDLRDTSARASQVAVGDGVLPIVGMFRLLRQMNYQGGVMLEYEIHPDNPLPGMHRSIGYMRGVLAALRS
ncbi:MAG TPA: sugar phosphate isomerase/epimerase [Bryobacteraceae bacterium]|nr:sugar phosphate isomerase/epimerase [Bryobacteraceae bacterium]